MQVLFEGEPIRIEFDDELSMTTESIPSFIRDKAEEDHPTDSDDLQPEEVSDAPKDVPEVQEEIMEAKTDEKPVEKVNIDTPAPSNGKISKLSRFRSIF